MHSNHYGMVVRVNIKLSSSIKHGSLSTDTELTCYGSPVEKGLSMIILCVYIGGIYSFNHQTQVAPKKTINKEERVHIVPYQLVGRFVENIGSSIHCFATPTSVWNL